MINVREALAQVIDKIDRARSSLNLAHDTLKRCEKVDNDKIYAIEIHFFGDRGGENRIRVENREAISRVKEIVLDVSRESAAQQAQSSYKSINELSALIPGGEKKDG